MQLMFQLQMPQTVPHSGRSPPPWSVGERTVPGSPGDLQQLLRMLGAASPPAPMPHSPPHAKPPPPYAPPADAFLEQLYTFPLYSPAPEDAPPSPRSPRSPYVKEEPRRFLTPDYSPYPPSPPASCGSSGSGCSPAPYHEEYIDIEALLKENQILQETVAEVAHIEGAYLTPKLERSPPRDHQLLRSVLEDTSFQKRLNLKPHALPLGPPVKMEAASGGGEPALAHLDQVLSMAIEQSRKDVDATCSALGISPDPTQWSAGDVKAWAMYTLQQYSLPLVPVEHFNMDGASLVTLTEDDFNQRAPQAGSTLYAQLEIWKAARHDSWPTHVWTQPEDTEQPTVLPTPDDISDEEDLEAACAAAASSGAPGKAPKSGGAHIHLWQFLKELLASPQLHGAAIRWIDRSNGVFKIEDSVRVARLWGKRKNRPAMNYDKLSRSIRQYYKKGIMKKTERSQRLVYQFCHPYCL